MGNEKKSYCTFQSLLNIQGLEMLFLFQMNIILSNPILLLCIRSLLAFKCPFVICHQNDHFIMLVLCLATHFCFKKYKKIGKKWQKKTQKKKKKKKKKKS